MSPGHSIVSQRSANALARLVNTFGAKKTVPWHSRFTPKSWKRPCSDGLCSVYAPYEGQPTVVTDDGRKVGAALLDVALPAHPVSVPAARHAIHETLGDVPAADVAELVVSELVTNAIVHAQKECHLRVLRQDGSLRIEVTDPSPEQPAPGPALPGGLEEEGRGLRIVQA